MAFIDDKYGDATA